MERISRIVKRVFLRPPLQTILIAVPVFALVIYALTKQIDGPLAYLSYAASAYALIITLTGFPGIVRTVKQSIEQHPLTRKALSVPVIKRFAEDVRFRTELSLHQGFTINLLYIVTKLVSGIYYRSLWFVVLALYYTLLAVMRFSLLYPIKAESIAARQNIELHRYRLCGIILLLMNQALAGIVAFLVHDNRSYEYPGLLIYVMAAYSFYAIIITIVNMVKLRKHGSPVLSAAKAINLAAAMVSILSLETAMLARFGDDNDPFFRKIMTGATGGGVCVIVLEMAVFMIVRSTRAIRKASKQLKGMNRYGREKRNF